MKQYRQYRKQHPVESCHQYRKGHPLYRVVNKILRCIVIRYIVTLTPSAFSTCASDLCVLCTHLLLDQPVHFTAPVHFTHAPITSSTCVFSALVHHICRFYACTYYYISLCIFSTCVLYKTHLLLDHPVHFQHLCIRPVHFMHTHRFLLRN